MSRATFAFWDDNDNFVYPPGFCAPTATNSGLLTNNALNVAFESKMSEGFSTVRNFIVADSPVGPWSTATQYAVKRYYHCYFKSAGIEWLMAAFNISTTFRLPMPKRIMALVSLRRPPMPVQFFNWLVDNFLSLSAEVRSWFKDGEAPSHRECFPLDLSLFPWLSDFFSQCGST